MSRFTTYAIKEITSSFLFLFILLSGILWMGQGLRHIELLTSDNVSFFAYLSYVVLLLPKIFLLTLPICIFLSILFNINRLRNDSELVILWAAGKADYDILFRPILFISILIYLFATILSIYITPISLNEIRHKIIDIRSSGIHSSILKEKKFISPVDTLTIFLQEREGDKITGLLIHDLKNSNKPQTYIAQRGLFIEENNKKLLRLFNGSVQIYERGQNKISEIEFETYDLNLTPYSKEENKHIYADELFTHQIIDNLKNKEMKDFNKYEKEQFAELHSRFINPLYIFCFALLPIMIIKFSAKPGDELLMPITLVSVVAFILQIVQITLSNILIENTNLIYFTYIFPFIVLILITFLIFLDRNQLKITPYAK